MIKLVGLGFNKSLDELNNTINQYIEESHKVYLVESLLELVSDKSKGRVEKISGDNFSNIVKEDNISFIALGNILLDYPFGKRLIKAIKESRFSYEVIRGESLLEVAYENIDCDETLNGLYNFEMAEIKKDKEFIIYGISNKNMAKKINEEIKSIYKKDLEVVYLSNLNNGKYLKNKKIKISQLENEEDLSLLSAIYINKEKRGFDDLVKIIEVLRAPNGCPWDKEQSHESLKRELVEECYEALDAIDEKNLDAMQEEIGDVLLHVVFQSLIARDNNEFDLTDVTDGICEKMIFRHPHIFGNEIANSSVEVIANWDEIKKEEKGYETLTDEINGIAKGLPALIRAQKVQKKAAKVDFDFKNFEEATKALENEIKEFKDVYKSKNMTRIEDELGDVIFSTVNVGRLLSLDCEEVLEKSTSKFIRRFSAIEKKAIEKNQNLSNLTVEEMNELWQEVKLEQK